MEADRVGWRHGSSREHGSAPGLALLGAFLLGTLVGVAWRDPTSARAPAVRELEQSLPPTHTPPLETRLERFEMVSARV